jgi:hypothetical protein
MDFIGKKWNQIYQNQNRITEYYKCLYSVNKPHRGFTEIPRAL